MSIEVETQRKLPFPIMRALVETYYDFQDMRMVSKNRLFGNKANIDLQALKEMGVNAIFEKAESFEKDISDILKAEVKKYEIYSEYLSHIYGIGHILSAGLIAYVEDPAKFSKTSKLKQYCGYGMNTFCITCDNPTYVVTKYKTKEGKVGKAKKFKPMKICDNCHEPTVTMVQERRVGFQINWNDKMKLHCWKIEDQFVKRPREKSGFRRIYEQVRKQIELEHPSEVKVTEKTELTGSRKKFKKQFTKGHVYKMARRKTVSVFLDHFLRKWREIEGLDTPQPYVERFLGHDVIKPFIDR